MIVVVVIEVLLESQERSDYLIRKLVGNYLLQTTKLFSETLGTQSVALVKKNLKKNPKDRAVNITFSLEESCERGKDSTETCKLSKSSVSFTETGEGTGRKHVTQ